MKLSSIKVALKKKKLLSFQRKFPIVFGQNLKVTIAIFEIGTLNFFNMLSFMQKQKLLTFTTKKDFLAGIRKSHCHI